MSHHLGPVRRQAGTMRERLGYAVAEAATGAAITLFAGSRVWLEVAVEGPARLGPVPDETRTGSDLLPWLPTVALVALAGAGALVATRGAARVVVGGLLVACGLAVVAAAVYAIAGGAVPWWPIAGAVGALFVIDSGVLTVARGRSWPSLGARFERPRETATGPQSMWDALDRGEDPTR